jgi:hypothetical protein
MGSQSMLIPTLLLTYLRVFTYCQGQLKPRRHFALYGLNLQEYNPRNKVGFNLYIRCNVLECCPVIGYRILSCMILVLFNTLPTILIRGRKCLPFRIMDEQFHVILNTYYLASGYR